MGKFGEQIGLMLAGILTVALVAVVVSRNAQTPQVLKAAGDALSGTIKAAVAPVSGSNLFSGVFN